jgi:hypothetical protein
VTPLPIGARDVLALSRDARRVGEGRGPLLVTGVLAEHLAKELAAGGEAGVVRTSGDPAKAAALVRVVAGPATAGDEAQLRAATRALVPIVVVQTGGTETRLPYVLPTDVVACQPGKGFPIGEIAATLAAVLGRNGPALAASLPVLQDAVQERRSEEGALTAGALALVGGEAPRLPVLSLSQARTLTDVSVAGGANLPDAPQEAARAIAPQIGAALATGLAAREVVRRLPFRNRLLDSAIAAAATYALATAFRRLTRR